MPGDFASPSSGPVSPICLVLRTAAATPPEEWEATDLAVADKREGDLAVAVRDRAEFLAFTHVAGRVAAATTARIVDREAAG